MQLVLIKNTFCFMIDMRDIKPGSLFINSENRIFLLLGELEPDFNESRGSAISVDRRGQVRIKQYNWLCIQERQLAEEEYFHE